ncbi:MAG: formylglycine-generating enzyme family protein [Planctomycetes bacterium]|nr:formylglycine-generating enzyme family protein [Planctomycetota bacterium]
MRWRHLLLLLPIVCCGCGDGPPSLSAAAAERLAAHASPTTWEDLDPMHPGQRLRDPRTGVVFRKIPAGEFAMGSTHPSEAPRHRVVISRPFLLAETELTIAQWRAHVTGFAGDPRVPVPRSAGELPMPVSWNDGLAFCERYGYRLPSEAEWEWACLGGLEPDDPSWIDETRVQAAAWVHANAGDQGHAVGTRQANGYGLCDMIGNVWEWCGDFYSETYAGRTDGIVDPRGPAQGQGRTLRGGSFFSLPHARPQSRTGDMALTRNEFYGLRPAREL